MRGNGQRLWGGVYRHHVCDLRYRCNGTQVRGGWHPAWDWSGSKGPRVPVREDLPDDIRECCEVLRDDLHEGMEAVADGLEGASWWDWCESATWQLLDYLGVL